MTFVKLKTGKGPVFLNADLIVSITDNEEGDAVILMSNGGRYSFECTAEEMMLNLCALIGADIEEGAGNDDEDFPSKN